MFVAVLAVLTYSLLYIPSFQTFIARRLTSYLRSSYGLNISIDKVKIQFVKTVELEGVYIEDLAGDTLLYSKSIELNLAGYNLDKNTFQLDHFALGKTRFRMVQEHPDSLSNVEKVINLFDTGDTTTTESQPFHLESQSVTIEDLRFSMYYAYDTTHEYGMDYEDMDISGISLNVEDLYVLDDSIVANVNYLKAREKSGFVLSSLKGATTVSPRLSEIKNLEIVTPKSHIKGTARLVSKRWRDYLDFIHKVKMEFDLEESKVYTGDVAIFAPELKEWDKTVFISGKLKGRVDNMRGKSIELNTLTGTEFAGNIDISGLPDFESSFITIDAKKIHTNAEDVQSIVNFAVDTGIVIPEELYNAGDIYFAGSFTGFPNQFTSYGIFTSDVGVLKTDLTLQEKDSTYFYKGRVVTEALNIGELTAIPDIGTLTSSVEVEGSGFNVDELDATINGTIDSFIYKEYNYADIFLDGDFEQAKFNGVVTCNDPNVNFDFNGEADFRPDRPILDFDVEVYALNLSALNLMTDSLESELSGAVKIRAEGYKVSDVTGTAELQNITYCQEDREYHFAEAKLIAKNGPREVQLLSPMLDVSIRGQFVPEELPQSFEALLADAIPAIKLKQTDKKKKPTPQDFSFSATVKDIALLKEFMPDTFKIKEGTSLNGFYNNITNIFEVNLDAPYIQYSDIRAYNTDLSIRKVNDVLSTDLSMGTIAFSDSLRFNNVDLLAKAINDNLQFSVAWVNNEANKGKLEGVGQVLGTGKFNIDLLPAELLVDGAIWKTTKQANIFYDSTRFNIRDFQLISGNQEISAEGRLSQLNSDKLNFTIRNFNIHAINSFYPIGYDMSGELDGKGYISNPYKNLNFQANITLKEWKFNNELLGNAVFDGNWARTDSAINITAYLEKGGERAFNLKGSYRPFARKNELDLKLNLDNFNLIAINALGIEEITRFKGFVSGAVDIKGASEAPVLNGSLVLKDAQLHVNYLNTTYHLNDKVQVHPDWIGFNRIVVFDEKGNKAIATGTANHTNYSNWNYDFSIDMTRFLCINTDVTMNELFYGTAYATGDVNISGYDDRLDIEVKARTDKGTKIAIPLGGAEEVSAQSLVRFINTGEPEKVQDEEADLTGINLDLDIEATEDAEVQLIFDEKIGDVINGKGNGRINLRITPSGDFKMYGNYEIVQGDYLFTLKNLVNKRFIINPGGTITWYGDPYEAYLDLTAVYYTRASLYDIMLTDDDRYKRLEQVNCIMKMSGRLMEPRIKFDIQVPAADDFVRGQLAVVTSDENELNKQFLSLLVARRFTPLQNGVKGGDLAGGSAVGNNSMELLSNQLTNYLNKGNRNFTLGVNLKSGDSRSTGEYTVIAGTRLFNDRLNIYTNVGVGSTTVAQQQQNANNFVGDVVAEYSLTKDGRLKAKAFNQTSDNLYTSSSLSPYIQGVGVSYSEQFDTFKEFRQNLLSLFTRRKKAEKLDPQPPIEMTSP